MSGLFFVWRLQYYHKMKNSFILHADSKFISPYTMSAYISLLEKEVPFEIKTLDLKAADHLRPSYGQQSLTSRIPTLQHNNFFLSESSAIAEYLEDIFPSPEYSALYPKNPADKARARQIQAWLRSDLMPIREERPTDVIYFSPSNLPLSDKAREAADKLITAADLLIKDNQDFLFSQWCIADMDLSLMINRLIKNNDPIPEKLIRYVKFQWERDSVKKWCQIKR